MIKSLNLPAGAGSFFSFSPENSVSAVRNCRITFLGRKNTQKASTYAAVSTEARRRRRPAESFYEVLRVKQNASTTEVKAAYRSLAKVYHPDAGGQPEEFFDGRNFIEIHDAYAALSDPAARSIYDLKKSTMLMPRSRISETEFCLNRRWETDQCW
ncbi:PREDICTED: chaperone protein dnaJ 11, chloroplastic [Nicotiana attenuata]|uniref:Chaperone protein dnaj 11, chloroplastic n=1 Tax=Nicotiana attenuata TaxID=49451 RepID=A0A1J6IVJ3_NICAT|nr:PREDICTED: chaperone protein dnaJ 11, chloroplastic [Nicotiana attenuata]OIS99152.1 chaperone protein dnaj 11, chloroplastic [Nicotiana attenuata]